MNPLGRLWLKRVVQHFSMKGGSGYDQSLKDVCRSAESGGLLPPVRRSYGSRAGARACIVRMALRQLRRTGRSGDPRPSPRGLCASRRRENLYQPREAAAELNPAHAGRGASSPPVHAGSALHQFHQSQAGKVLLAGLCPQGAALHVEKPRSRARQPVRAGSRSCPPVGPY